MAFASTCRPALAWPSLASARSWFCLSGVSSPIPGPAAGPTPKASLDNQAKTFATFNASEFNGPLEPVQSEAIIVRSNSCVSLNIELKRLPQSNIQEEQEEPAQKFKPIEVASLAPGLKSTGPVKWCELNYESLNRMLDNGSVWLIDVREENEIRKAGTIPDSINIPLSALKKALLQDSDDFMLQYGFPKPQKNDAQVVFYSLNHVKGGTALQIAHRLGFRKARQYVGGYEDWLARQTSFSEMEEVQ